MTKYKHKLTIKDMAISIRHMHGYPDSPDTLLLVFVSNEDKNRFEDAIMQHYEVAAEIKLKN